MNATTKTNDDTVMRIRLAAYNRAKSVALTILNTLPGACRVSIRGGGNTIERSRARVLRRVSVTIEGADNSVVFASGCRLRDCRVTIRGNGNRVTVDAATCMNDTAMMLAGNDNVVEIGAECVVNALGIVCERDSNSVAIGDGTEVAGATELAALEGTRLTVGAHCLFSSGVRVRTGDSHSITSLDGKRINPSTDVSVGDHVWVGTAVLVLKGAVIPNSSVIGAGSVVTRMFEESNCVIAGNPARVVRRETDWRVELLPLEADGQPTPDRAVVQASERDASASMKSTTRRSVASQHSH